MSTEETIMYDYEAASANSQTAQERALFNLFALLKPELMRDGNQWCVLYGENLQEGIAGFGDSPTDAITDFNEQWYTNLPSTHHVGVDMASGPGESVTMPPRPYTCKDWPNDDETCCWECEALTINLCTSHITRLDMVDEYVCAKCLADTGGG